MTNAGYGLPNDRMTDQNVLDDWEQSVPPENIVPVIKATKLTRGLDIEKTICNKYGEDSNFRDIVRNIHDYPNYNM